MYMQPRKTKFKCVQINMKQVSYVEFDGFFLICISFEWQVTNVLVYNCYVYIDLSYLMIYIPIRKQDKTLTFYFFSMQTDVGLHLLVMSPN